MKKVITIFLFISLLFSCNQNVKVQDEEISFEDKILSLTLSKDYRLSDDEVEEELSLLANELNTSDGLENESYDYKFKSSKVSAEFQVKKIGDYNISSEGRELNCWRVKRKSFDQSDEEIVDEIKLSKYQIQYDDGSYSECITSNDKRIGAVLFISDPISTKDPDDEISDTEQADAQRFLDNFIAEYVDNSVQEIEGVFEDLSGSVSTEPRSKRRPIYLPLSSWKNIVYIPVMLKTEWKQTGWITDKLSKNTPKVLGCGAVATSQIALYHKRWRGYSRRELEYFENHQYNYYVRKLWLADLARMVYEDTKSRYVSGGTATYMPDMYWAFLKNEYDATLCINRSDLITNSALCDWVQAGPVLAASDDHAYVVDGVKKQHRNCIDMTTRRRVIEIKYMFHKNLGWGGKANGWYEGSNGYIPLTEAIHDIKPLPIKINSKPLR